MTARDGTVSHWLLDRPPPRTWFFTRDDSWQVGASTRSWAAVAFISLFLLLSIGLGWTVTRMAIRDLGPGLAASLMSLPFWLGPIMLLAATALFAVGKVTVSVRGDRGVVFSGIGPLGTRRRFRWSEITLVEEEEVVTSSRLSSGTKRQPMVALVGNTRIHCGFMLSPERRQFIIEVLRTILKAERG
jgi:hypothetical protein